MLSQCILNGRLLYSLPLPLPPGFCTHSQLSLLSFIIMYSTFSDSAFQTIWIGMNDGDVEGQYVNNDGTAVDYVNWRDNQPDNWNNEDCVHMFFKGEMNDAFCSLMYRFVCKCAVEFSDLHLNY